MNDADYTGVQLITDARNYDYEIVYYCYSSCMETSILIAPQILRLSERNEYIGIEIVTILVPVVASSYGSDHTGLSILNDSASQLSYFRINVDVIERSLT